MKDQIGLFCRLSKENQALGTQSQPLLPLHPEAKEMEERKREQIKERFTSDMTDTSTLADPKCVCHECLCWCDLSCVHMCLLDKDGEIEESDESDNDGEIDEGEDERPVDTHPEVQVQLLQEQ